jgi:hypothetical protein
MKSIKVLLSVLLLALAATAQTVKISALPAGAPAQSTDLVPIARSSGCAPHGDCSLQISDILLAAVIPAGTTFTSSGGLDETTLLGGSTVGKFTTATVTTGSTVITMGASVSAAPHGWRCNAADITHPLDIIVGTSVSTTTCRLTVAVAITAGDVIEFSALGY